jgi:hypothetical protein
VFCSPFLRGNNIEIHYVMNVIDFIHKLEVIDVHMCMFEYTLFNQF